MTHYALMIIGSRSVEAAVDTSNAQAEFGAWDAELTNAGVKVHGAPFYPDADARSVSVRNGETTSRGPVDDDEYLGGYTVVDVADIAAAETWAARCPGAKYGRIEVRQLFVM